MSSSLYITTSTIGHTITYGPLAGGTYTIGPTTTTTSWFVPEYLDNLIMQTYIAPDGNTYEVGCSNDFTIGYVIKSNSKEYKAGDVLYYRNTLGEIMTSPVKVEVEDLVKVAIKEQLDKRRAVEAAEGVVEEAVREINREPEMKEVALAPGEVHCYTLVDTKKTTKNSFAVRIHEKDEWDERIRFLIPEVEEGYILPVNESIDVLRAWAVKDKTLIYGPTGAGKSSLIKQLCALTNRPFLRINATGDMDSSMIFGQLTAKDASTVWVDGAVTEAVKYGAILCWDEWEVTPPEIAMGMQWLLEDNSKLFLKEMPGESKEKFITPHEDFRIVCAGNTQGQGDETGHHAGVNVQNTATLDRFGTVIKLDYLSAEHETKVIMGKVPSIKKEVAGMMIKVANLIRQAYKTNQLSITMSPRTLIGIAKKLEFGVAFAEALKLQYLNKLTDTQQRVALELVRKVVGELK